MEHCVDQSALQRTLHNTGRYVLRRLRAGRITAKQKAEKLQQQRAELWKLHLPIPTALLTPYTVQEGRR